jgi:hypothetical protein
VHQSTARTDARRDIHLTVCNAKLYTLTVWEAAHARQQLSGYKGAAQRYSSPAMAVILLCVHMQFDAWIRDLLLLRCMAQLFELVFLEPSHAKALFLQATSIEAATSSAARLC